MTDELPAPSGSDEQAGGASEKEEALLPADPSGRRGETEQSTVRGSFASRFWRASGDGLVANILAISGAALSFSGSETVGLVVCVAAVATPLLLRRKLLLRVNRAVSPTGSYVISRIVLALVIGNFDETTTREFGPGWIAAAAVAILTAIEANVARVARGAIAYGAHLPGISVRNTRMVSAGWVYVANVAALVIMLALAAVGAPPFLLLLPVALAAPLTAIVLIDGILRIRSRRIAERQLNDAIDNYSPSFIVHWDAPAGALYQLAMWLPFLDRLGLRYIVVVRNPANFRPLTEITSVPVLLRREMVDMDALITPSLRAALYVNTAAKNVHLIRYTHITHIQLNHGDSDKAPSYNRYFRMFDKNLVAGQAAIDRFRRHGIAVTDDMFSIVGRPQVEAVEVAHGHIAEATSKTVLYAPTWSGFYQDSNYSSLPLAESLVAALIDRDCRVVFRPHPYTSRSRELTQYAQRVNAMLEEDSSSNGRAHVWGDEATRELSVFDCFNMSDALITDVSSVGPDFLFSEKPFAISAMTTEVQNIVDDFPIAGAAYIVDPTAQDWKALLDDLLEKDPLRDVRGEMKRYYLGDLPSENYAETFIEEARRLIGE